MSEQGPLDPRLVRRNNAVAAIARSCRLSWGKLEISVWREQLIAVRPDYTFGASGTPELLPDPYELAGEPENRQAAGILVELYGRRSAVFEVALERGDIKNFRVRWPERPEDDE